MSNAHASCQGNLSSLEIKSLKKDFGEHIGERIEIKRLNTPVREGIIVAVSDAFVEIDFEFVSNWTVYGPLRVLYRYIVDYRFLGKPQKVYDTEEK